MPSTTQPDVAAAGLARQEHAWLPISSAARALGVSPSTLRAWAEEGRVPHVRTAGGHRRFNADELAEWLAAHARAHAPRPERSPGLTPAPELADLLVSHDERITQIVEQDLGTTDDAVHVARRPGTAVDWVTVVADVLRLGWLGKGLEQARAYGYARGVAGVSAADALAGPLATGRAIDAVLSEESVVVSSEERDRVAGVMRRITVRVADGWADATRDRTLDPVARA